MQGSLIDMNKRAYIFYLMILICGFTIAYVAGFKIGSGSEQSNIEKEVNVDPEESTNTPTDGYWVKSVNDKIYVYKSDKETLVAETDINISGLSDKEKNILENGVYLENAEELFKYLEANTS